MVKKTATKRMTSRELQEEAAGLLKKSNRQLQTVTRTVSMLAASVNTLGRHLERVNVPSTKGPGIFVSSKIAYAALWKDYRNSGWPIVSSWLDKHEEGPILSLSDLWKRNLKEASEAAVFVLYIEPGDELKGSLIELGAALASGTPTLVVGAPKGHSIWAHSLIEEFGSIGQAMNRAMRIVGVPIEDI